MIRSYYSQPSSFQSPHYRELLVSYLKKALIYLMGPFLGLWLMASHQSQQTEEEDQLHVEASESVATYPVSSITWLFHP
ncbi:MAG: hypothetical protein AAF388_13740 [Bacteroidota bacterium]